MPRIGLAYNLKPDASTSSASAARSDETASLGDDEPPSTRRDFQSRSSDSPATAGAVVAPPSTAPADDEFAEWDDRSTIDAVARALAALGEVVHLEANDDFPETLRRERPDIVFNMAEGLHGPNREAHVPAICEFFDIPYSGSDPFTLALCLDKARTKEILSHHAIPNAPFRVIRDERDLGALRARLAVAQSDDPGSLLGLGAIDAIFVKPLHEGSSKGITEKNLCRDAHALVEQTTFLLEHYQQPVLAEAYLPGAEFTCAVLGNGETAEMLPIVAMNFAALPEGALPVYGFEAKWIWDRPERPLEIFECPARIEPELEAAIRHVVLDAYRVLGCRDWSRIDVRLDAAGVPNVVEVNPLPGILPDPADNSCLPKSARAAGLEYEELIRQCLRYAADRHAIALGAPRRVGAHARADARVAAQR